MVTCANHNGYASQLSYFADYNNIINKYTLQILQSRIHFTRTQEKKIVFAGKENRFQMFLCTYARL